MARHLDEVCAAGPLAIRLLRDDDADVAQLAAWLTDERVLEWYAGRDQPADVARVRAEYTPAARATRGVVPGFALLDGEPVGYVQWYRVAPLAEEYGVADDGNADLADTWALDLFVGRADLWGAGLGTRITRLLVDHLLVSEAASRVLIDPRVVNARAIRAYEKCGFRKVRVLPRHERHEGEWFDNWLMEVRAEDDPVGLTAALARIDSVNPSLVAGAAGEAGVAELVAAWCRAHGFEVHRQPAAPGRSNVIAVRRGRGGGRSLLLNAHMDTVGVGAGAVAVHLGDARLEGRGVLDTKGGLAAALIAAARVDPGAVRGDVIVAAVVDEEHGSLGTEALVREWSADAAVVLEPTDLRIVTRHRGYAVIDVRLAGRAAHTSRPHLGINAVAAAADVAVALAALDASWAASALADGTTHGDRPSVLVNRIDCEGEQFTVPPAATMSVEVRTATPDPAAQVQAVLHVITAAAGAAEVSTTVSLSRAPMTIRADHPLVELLAATLGRTDVTSAPYWTDAALHASAGVPAVVVGPAGEGLHEDLEWVTTDSLRTLTSALERTIRQWCG